MESLLASRYKTYHAVIMVVLNDEVDFSKKMKIFKTWIFIFSDAFSSMGKSVMQDLLNAFPGIDEAMSYSEVMK